MGDVGEAGSESDVMEVERNPTMVGGNRFKLAVFGSNCSSGRAATTVPERWQNTFADNIRLAQLADAAGLEAMVLIGRWKDYGGATDFEFNSHKSPSRRVWGSRVAKMHVLDDR